MHFSLESSAQRQPLIIAKPSERLEFLERQLGEHSSIRLIVTEAVDARSENPRGPLAHSLTIERRGKGYLVQDVTVDADRNVTVGEHLITRRGRFVQLTTGADVTTLSDLKSLLSKTSSPTTDPSRRYRDASSSALIDRLVVGEAMSLETKQKSPEQGIVIHKSEFDALMKRAVTSLGDEVQARLKANTLSHPFRETVDMLLPLAKARAAQVQLSKTLAQTGLAGFTFSGNDMM